MEIYVQSDVKDAKEIEEIGAIIQSISCLLKKPISRESYEIKGKKAPHTPKSLPEGKIAVSIFKYGDEYLKTGRFGPNSNARFQSQHYLPNSSLSNLAKSILNDSNFHEQGLNANNIGDWIKNNCRRIDIIIDENLGSSTSELIKAALNYRFRPKYEGKKMSNKLKDQFFTVLGKFSPHPDADY